MSIMANVKAEGKTTNYGKPRNWETKLGPVVPKVTPDELMEAIFNGGPNMAMDFLKSSGKIAFFPGCHMTTAEHISSFYGVDAAYISQLHSQKMRKYRDAGRHVSVVLSTKEVLKDLRKRGVHGNVRTGKWHIHLSICGEGIECSHYALPNGGKTSYYTPEAVLVMAVCMFTSTSKQKSQVADNLVARLISSEYVDIALELRAEKVRQAVKDARQSTIIEVSEEVVPEVSESVVEAPAASEEVEERPKSEQDELIEKLTQAIKEGKVDAVKVDPANVSIDLVKTLVAMMGTLTAVAIVPFFKALMTDCMGDAMRKFFSDMVKVE